MFRIVFALALAAALLFAESASAQCPGGNCPQAPAAPRLVGRSRSVAVSSRSVTVQRGRLFRVPLLWRFRR